MELIFKKYHTRDDDTELNYLIFDPSMNSGQLTKELRQSISGRNFGQNYARLLMGPIWKGQKMTARVFTSDGNEIPYDDTDIQILISCMSHGKSCGTVYLFC